MAHSACGVGWARHDRRLAPSRPVMPEDERPPEACSFEEAMESLDSIVASLEGDQLSLEQMVTSYERGMRLLHVCRGRIENARLRVESIGLDLENQKAVLTDFSAAEATEAPRPAVSAPKKAAKSLKPEIDSGAAGSDEIRLF